jgi:hypothetical protein
MICGIIILFAVTDVPEINMEGNYSDGVKRFFLKFCVTAQWVTFKFDISAPPSAGVGMQFPRSAVTIQGGSLKSERIDRL